VSTEVTDAALGTVADVPTERESGFTLVEVLVGAVILALAFASVFAMSWQASRMLRFAREESRSTQAAQYELERLRTLNWSSLNAMGDATVVGPSVNPILADLDEATATIQKVSGGTPDVQLVGVTVVWRRFSGGVCRKSMVSVFGKNGLAE
jgi:prepilin-type N-terminal cleavage/methylation domain-containing protein